MANAITMTSALDLPWQGRYTSTVQYNMMRQNDPFVSTAINGLAPAPLPGTSLDGKVDTLLLNNVLTTQITKDLKATFRYRYYDFNNQTPERIYTNYVEADSLLGSGPRRNLSIAYTKQNAGAELNWRMAKGVNVGAAYLWEQWDRTRRDVNITDEHGGKFFADVALWGDSKARGSVSYSQRRYDRYDEVELVEDIGLQFSENVAEMRKFDIANRDRLQGRGLPRHPVRRLRDRDADRRLPRRLLS